MAKELDNHQTSYHKGKEKLQKERILDYITNVAKSTASKSGSLGEGENPPFSCLTYFVENFPLNVTSFDSCQKQIKFEFFHAAFKKTISFKSQKGSKIQPCPISTKSD